MNLPEDKTKKQIPLRLSVSLWNEIASWAEEDFRSLNSQIEYLLSESVKRRKKGRDNSESICLAQEEVWPYE
ncbi:MAG: Arc family DNA-binding protein [Oscillospiraceae bacterium]|nr:Arc family DNA-binding protein [Oscillospiraceae bacterium]